MLDLGHLLGQWTRAVREARDGAGGIGGDAAVGREGVGRAEGWEAVVDGLTEVALGRVGGVHRRSGEVGLGEVWRGRGGGRGASGHGRWNLAGLYPSNRPGSGITVDGVENSLCHSSFPRRSLLFAVVPSAAKTHTRIPRLISRHPILMSPSRLKTAPVALLRTLSTSAIRRQEAFGTVGSVPVRRPVGGFRCVPLSWPVRSR